MNPQELFSKDVSRGVHLSGDIHNIGESLPAPDSVSNVGNEGWIGESNAPARADHIHGPGGEIFHHHEIIWSYGPTVNPSSDTTLNRYVYSHWETFHAIGAILTYVSAASSETIEVEIYIDDVLEDTLEITSGNTRADQSFVVDISDGSELVAVVKANASADGEDLTIIISGYIKCSEVAIPL